MTSVISIVVVFGALIFFHELGHLILAKRAGILCREFAIGFGPKLFSFVRNETVYTIRLLPLGGFVRMAGEDPELIDIKTGHDVAVITNREGQVEKLIINNKKDFPEAKTINVSKIDLVHKLVIEGYDHEDQLLSFDVHPQAKMVYNGKETQIAPWDRQFGSKTVGQRALAIFAGPLANFLLAVVLLFAFALYNGLPGEEALIGEVIPDSAALEAGLQDGDLVTAINGESIQRWTDFQRIISSYPEQEVNLTISRDGQQIEVPVTPMSRETQTLEGEVVYEGFIGVAPATERSFLAAIQYGFVRTYEIIALLFQALGMLVTGTFTIDDLAGPVGIFQITGQAAEQGLAVLLQFAAFLSINLGIMNLLPIPALDGGRLIFIGLEALRGKPIDPQKESLVHFVGFALLMLLILVVTWNDIQRIFF
ncbi:RIP metalloprotease RseP [Bacillus horti]|uniref:Zinc metalloprotease n=1 Tax=Caldalkalibacillus horti TaxID=77523 RepID=A0ABT9VVN6_9BACI|nr:RIP metalloprotease RseP [Bacillus horti]MDQ0164700.1 regulator of sigma E protease [Bacillus horti]